MASNVLPFFWHLASSSKDARLTASADLVSTLQTFQSTYLENRPAVDGDEDEEEDEDESDDESGEEVDPSDDEEDAQIQEEGKKLDKQLASNNAEDVVYTVKRLVRGLASSRESSRLGFAVALTELLTRVDTITAPQVLSLVIRSSPHSSSMRGPDVRDALFARLFGITSIIQSGSLFAPTSSLETFDRVIDNLLELGQAKGWLRESAWWGILGATEGVSQGNVEWAAKAVDSVVEKVYADKAWSQEKIALTLVLEARRPDLPWKSLFAPTFKHTPLLHSQNLHVIARLLKDSDFVDEEEGSKLSVSTGSWKPQLHFVWDKIFDAYFTPSPSPTTGRAQFQDFFRAVVDESLFSNASSSERKFWGFSVLSRALPIMPPAQLPLLFTPNVMRIWTSELASAERYLHKAALNLAKDVQNTVKTNPTVGFALLSALVKGKGDFDKVTKTKTVETIMGSLNEEGVRDYIEYLKNIILGEEQNGADNAGLEERRQWALTQIYGLYKNHKVPKSDAVIASTLDFLLVHGFFIVRKTDKKSAISALHSAPKPALSETTAAATRSKFFSCLVELTTAPITSKDKDGKAHQPGCDASGRLWLRRVIDTLIQVEGDSKHAELVMDADDEIKKLRKEAVSTLAQLDKKSKVDAEVARGVEILLSFSLLQTYDESEDALELLEEVNGAAQRMFKIGSQATEEDEHPPIDTLLDVLIALLEKGSAGLKDLGKLVVGMVGSAFTLSTVEHLVAQLEQTAPEAIEVDEDEDGAEVEAEDGSDDAEDDDEDDESESGEEESDDDEDEANLEVDPEFRRRVQEALAGAGVNVDEDAEEGSDDDSDEEVWDDEQMLKVDDQLAEVFRQRANAGKSTDLKHLHIQSVHFKTRILDFFEVLAKKQSTNPIILHIIVPLLRLVSNASPTEKDLSNKATSILRTRLSQAKDVPSTADAKTCSTILNEIHAFARRAPSIEFSQICSSCSIFVFRTLDASAPTSNAALDAYRATLTDYMSRKTSSVHPVFINDLLKRYPVRAFPLAADLLRHAAGENVKKLYNQTQAYSMLTFFSQQLNTLSKALPRETVIDFVRSSVQTTYTLLEKTPAAGSEWDASRIREVIRFALHLARSSKAAFGEEIIAEVWDTARLDKLVQAFQTEERTANMKGVQNDIRQLKAVLVLKADKEQTKKGKKLQKRKAGEEADEADKMDLDEPEVAPAKETKPKAKKAKANGDAPAKKRKVKAEKAEKAKAE